MRKNDLLDYIIGDIQEEKRKEVSEWINRNEDNRKYFNNLKESFILMSLPDSRVSEQDYAAFQKKYGFSKCCKVRWISFSIAAAIALFVMIGLNCHNFGNKASSKVIRNNTSELLVTNLPDGSTIGLSPDSELRYNKYFGKTCRKVYLNGTCYFDVAKNKEIPFKVKAADRRILIEVTGTKFYTSNHPQGNCYGQFEIALIEGSVNVKMSNNCIKQQTALVPGEHLEITEDYTLIKSSLATKECELMEDMDHYLDFKDAKLSDIVNRLSLIHHRKFKFKNSKIEDYLLTANFSNSTLDDILLIFEVTMNVRSSIAADGTVRLY